jgi:hypothetical protein
MVQQTDPAKRLHDILKAAMAGPGEQAMLQVWMEAFRLQDPTEFKVVRCLFSMAEALDETRRRLEELRETIDLELYASELHRIEVIISPCRLNESRANVLHKHLGGSSSVLKDLLFCSSVLKRNGGAEDAEVDVELKDFEAAITVLFQAVLESKIKDGDFKAELLRALESMRAGIAQYRIRGIDALRDGQRMLRGTLAVHQPEVQAAGTEKESFIYRALDWLLETGERLAARVKRGKKLVDDVKPIAGEIKEQLEHLSKGAPSGDAPPADNVGPAVCEA